MMKEGKYIQKIHNNLLKNQHTHFIKHYIHAIEKPDFTLAHVHNLEK